MKKEVTKQSGLNLNLLDQLTFYGSYHNNKWNQLIHFVFVPSIVWSICVWHCYTGTLAADIENKLQIFPLKEYLVLNGAFVIVAVYSLFYLSLDFIAGLSWIFFVGVPIWVSATAFYQLAPNAWLWAILVNIFSWYMQIHPGHAILEKRRPALMDSLVQAVALAPLFVWFELLFLLGYRRDLYRQLQARVGTNIAQYRRSLKKNS